MSCSILEGRRLPTWLPILLFWVSPALHSAEPLTLFEAISLAQMEAPGIRARQAAVSAADSAVEPAGQLPDPELSFGLQDLPVTTNEAFSVTRDDFTMRKIGVMQRFPRHEKRECPRRLKIDPLCRFKSDPGPSVELGVVDALRV